MTPAYAKPATDTSDPSPCIPAGLRFIRPDETTHPDVQFLAARSLAIDAQPPSLFVLDWTPGAET
jgi:hypothetical protein